MIDIIMKATISTHASRHLFRASIVVYTMLNEIFSPYKQLTNVLLMRESVCILGKFLNRHYEHNKLAETF